MSRGFSSILSALVVPLRRSALRRQRRYCLCALALVLITFAGLAAPNAVAQSASTWSKHGSDAESREDFDAAYEDYKHAHELKPKDLGYLTRFDRTRAEAANQHIDRGRILRQSGDFAGSMLQFMRARDLDPSNQAAQQEIDRSQRQQPALTAAGSPTPGQMSRQGEALDAINSIDSPVELKSLSNDPLSLHVMEDVKQVYDAIGKTAGLNVLFDPELSARPIRVDLNDVSLNEALRIVGTIAGTFYKPVTANTIFVAQNTHTKRSDLDDLAVQTFYLTNAVGQNDGNEIMTGLRLLLDASAKIYLVSTQNALVVRATTDQLLLAEKLINDFDRGRPEVVVDVAVLEVNRDKIRTLGITLPTSVGIAPQSTTTSTTSATGTTTGTSTGSLTLNNLTHLNSNNFAVSVSGGTVNALLSDADTRVLQNPRIRATDGQRATLKIGQKIPVATGSYNAGVSAGIGSIGVQTQFTYLDVGVNVDITPTVHRDRDVSLKLRLEVSQQNGSVTISGVTEPIIAQRVLEQSIQLKDGEPSILAGIVTRQNNKTASGTPYAGEAPILKYFFSTQSTEAQQDELVFLLVPHIVRDSVLSRLNMAVIDTGTATSIELRRRQGHISEASATMPAPLFEDHPVPPTAANAATTALQQLDQQSKPEPDTIRERPAPAPPLQPVAQTISPVIAPAFAPPPPKRSPAAATPTPAPAPTTPVAAPTAPTSAPAANDVYGPYVPYDPPKAKLPAVKGTQPATQPAVKPIVSIPPAKAASESFQPRLPDKKVTEIQPQQSEERTGVSKPPDEEITIAPPEVVQPVRPTAKIPKAAAAPAASSVTRDVYGPYVPYEPPSQKTARPATSSDSRDLSPTLY